MFLVNLVGFLTKSIGCLVLIWMKIHQILAYWTNNKDKILMKVVLWKMKILNTMKIWW